MKQSTKHTWTLPGSATADIEVEDGNVITLGLTYNPAQVPDLCAALGEAASLAWTQRRERSADVPPGPPLGDASERPHLKDRP